jgi:hypothetical protein
MPFPSITMNGDPSPIPAGRIDHKLYCWSLGWNSYCVGREVGVVEGRDIWNPENRAKQVITSGAEAVKLREQKMKRGYASRRG